MLGAAINVIPIMLQRSVPGIGPHVMPAYLLAALPALLAALAYASLASAMPRAGGSYVYVSRSLSPYWGFVASFSQWFGLSIAIVAGFMYDHADFAAALMSAEGRAVPAEPEAPFRLGPSVLLLHRLRRDCAGGRRGPAARPQPPPRDRLAVLTVGTFYLLFTAAVYHAVPWSFMAEEARWRSSRGGGRAHQLSPRDAAGGLAPHVRLGGRRDLPRVAGAVHPRRRTPHVALVASGAMASAGILGSHFAGDFFLGVDILVTSMLVNFLLMSLSLLMLARRNPERAAEMRVLSGRSGSGSPGWWGSRYLRSSSWCTSTRT